MRCWRSIPTTTRSSASSSAARRIGSRSASDRQAVRLVQDQEPVAVIDADRPMTVGTIAIPHGAEGIAVSPDGWALYVCAHRKGVLHVFDTRTLALHRTIAIDGAPGEPISCAACECRRTGTMSACRRMSTITPPSTKPQAQADRRLPDPEGADGLRLRRRRPARLSVLPRRRGHAEFELRRGRITRQFETAAGCEFVISYCRNGLLKNREPLSP